MICDVKFREDGAANYYAPDLGRRITVRRVVRQHFLAMSPAARREVMRRGVRLTNQPAFSLWPAGMKYRLYDLWRRQSDRIFGVLTMQLFSDNPLLRWKLTSKEAPGDTISPSPDL